MRCRVPSPIPFNVATVTSFLLYLFQIKQVKPGTCSNYLSGVRFFLLNFNIDIEFLHQARAIKATKTGIHNHYRSLVPASDERTAPFSCDMLVHGISVVHNTQQFRHRCINVAQMASRSCLMRSSEVIPTHDNKTHFLR